MLELLNVLSISQKSTESKIIFIRSQTLHKMAVSVQYSELSEILINKNKESMIEFIKTKFNLNDEEVHLHKRHVDQFVINHNFRWKKKSKCRRDHFYKQYGTWLQQVFVLKEVVPAKRELKPFNECSERTKKRRLAAEKNKS